jgi:carbamoyltransferase
MRGALLGPEFRATEVESELVALGARFDRLDESTLLSRTAELLAEGKVVGWFDGPMEFGPRALGARSILADPRDPAMQRTLNLKIKFRESFRPFAPSVLAERAGEFFELSDESPYMLIVTAVREAHRLATPADRASRPPIERAAAPRSTVPAVTHLDHSARVQTVSRARSPRYHALLRAFEARTGCPMLVNTSFNVRGEPIVSTPAEAYRCFLRTEMDALVVFPFLMLRENQPAAAANDHPSWTQTFPLD